MPRLDETIIPRLTSIALLLFLASGLSACGQRKKGGSDLARSEATPAPSPDRKIFRTGEAVPAGYLGYKVYGSWFTDHLSTQSGAGKSPTSYLYVDLSVVNTDKKERPVDLLKLIDENGKEYVLSEKASAVEQSLGRIGKLAPSMSKRAFAIFEVPSGHQYQLKIPGFSAADEVTIELTPTTAPAK
jgi:hypothetical protein